MAWYDGLNDRMNARAGEQDAARSAAASEAERIAKIRSAGEASGAASEAARSNSAIAAEQTAGTQLPTVDRLGGAATGGIAGVDTNIDTSPLQNVDVNRLGTAASDISKAGEQKVTSADVDRLSSIRPENQYEKTLQSTIGKLEDYTTGVSQADRTAANFMLSRFDASSAASNLAQAQRIAANPFITEGGKAAAVAEQMRETGTQRAGVVGQLAQQAQERAYQATQKLADVAQTAAAFKEGQFEFDVGQAGEELSRNITAKVKAGELTQAQAALELEKASMEINAATASKQLELDKQKAVAADANQKSQIEQQQAELAMTKQSYYGSTASNLVMSAWDDNPELTSADLMNNPATMQAMTNYHQAMPGNEGTVPDEDDIAAYMTQMKPEWRVAKDTMQRNLDELKTTLTASGADTETIDFMSDYINIIDQSGGALSMNPDGSIFISGADGQPITYKDEYGNDVEMSFGDDSRKGSDVVSSLTSAVSEKTFNEMLTGITNGDYSGVDEFKFYLEQGAKNAGKTLNVSDAEIEKIFNDAASGKLKPGELTTSSGASGTDEFDPKTGDVDIENVWSKNNKAILSDPNNENFEVALNNAIDDAIDGTGKANLLSQVKNNPKLKEELFSRAVDHKSLSDTARNPGDFMIDENGNLRMILRQEGKSTASFIISANEDYNPLDKLPFGTGDFIKRKFIDEKLDTTETPTTLPSTPRVRRGV